MWDPNVAVKTYNVTDVVVMDTSKVYAGLRIDKTEMIRCPEFLSIVMEKSNVIISGNLSHAKELSQSTM